MLKKVYVHLKYLRKEKASQLILCHSVVPIACFILQCGFLFRPACPAQHKYITVNPKEPGIRNVSLEDVLYGAFTSILLLY